MSFFLSPDILRNILLFAYNDKFSPTNVGRVEGKIIILCVLMLMILLLDGEIVHSELSAFNHFPKS